MCFSGSVIIVKVLLLLKQIDSVRRTVSSQLQPVPECKENSNVRQIPVIVILFPSHTSLWREFEKNKNLTNT